MGINHGGADIFVAKQFLHRADIVSVLQEMASEAVTKGMVGDEFIDPGHLGSLLDRLIQTALMNMMTSLYVFVLSVAGGRKPSVADCRSETSDKSSDRLQLPYGLAIAAGVCAAAAIVALWGTEWLRLW